MFGSSPITSCHETQATFYYRKQAFLHTNLRDPAPRRAPLRNSGQHLQQIDHYRVNAFLSLDGLPIARTDKKYSKVWQAFNQRKRRALVKEKAERLSSLSPGSSPTRSQRRTLSLMSSRLSKY